MVLWCCGDGQPSGEDWYVVLTFGDDQKGFKLQFATDEGKEICAKVSTTASRRPFWLGCVLVLLPLCSAILSGLGLVGTVSTRR